MDFHTCTPKQWVENEENSATNLEDPSVWDKIPLLNVNELHHLKDGTLVRFRGMIQDMHSPEYYFEKFETINQKTKEKSYKSGKYSDGAISNDDECINFDSDQNVTSERHTFVVISIPAINDWVQRIEEERYKLPVGNPPCPSSTKRTFEEAMESGDIIKEEDAKSDAGESSKRACTNNSLREQNSRLLSKEFILNFPLPSRSGKTCHLKVYKKSEELKLNDMCEFVGFLAMDPLTEAAYQEEEDDNKMETEALHPPSSLVPRIHCISFKKLRHNNPLLSGSDEAMDINKINFLRKELLILLTQLLLGDELAAEYLILHLISEVYLRRDFMPLGKFSLNISNIPQLQNIDYSSELYKFIELLTTKSHYLPMTLQNMNELSFIPKKDYECNRLTSGILQLSRNTHLVLDETKLSSGKLDAAGVNSIKAISSAIKTQKVSYDFNYYPLEFDCDIPFLILSEGKSMINVDTHVILKPEDICLDTFSEIVMAAKHFLKPELLNDLRKYLTLARLTKYEISENVESLVQNEFVNMRQNGAVTADDLHNLLVLARLVCISQGKGTLDEECWKKACSLEGQRRARITR